jgi:cytochrome c-type biogenesis protein CcmH
MIWLLLLLLGLAVLLALWRSGAFTRATLQFLGAALMIAAAGYAWQGRPGLAGRPAEATARPELPQTAFATLRPKFFPRFDTASRWLIIADSYQRRGETADAVGVIRSAIRQYPNNLALWTGLGNALVLHGGGTMSPAAELAYRRAAAIAPNHPAPSFFYGLGLIQSGQVEAGEAAWRDLLAKAPVDASWRPVVADRLALIDRLRTAQQPPR